MRNAFRRKLRERIPHFAATLHVAWHSGYSKQLDDQRPVPLECIPNDLHRPKPLQELAKGCSRNDRSHPKARVIQLRQDDLLHKIRAALLAPTISELDVELIAS
ncbi:hypothetical protein D9M68_929390 [compost metagenome]